MEENRKNGVECDECEQDFRNEINELVDNVENLNQAETDQKREEVESAFGTKGDMC